MEFRDYQKQIIKDGVKIISRHGFVYLAMEVRTGKTFTALGIAQKLYVSKVLFVTKKKPSALLKLTTNLFCPPIGLMLSTMKVYIR